MKNDIHEMTADELVTEIERTLRQSRQGVQAASRVVTLMEQTMARARLLDYRQGRGPHIVPLQ